MIGMAAAVVAHGRADVLRHLVDPAQQLLERPVLQLRVLGESLVQLGDVGRVVLVVMDLHRLRVDVRLERVEGIGQ